jgi:DNA polymerase-3 subunit epsilon
MKPIVMLDLETTGLSTSQDRIIEIGLVKRLSDGTVEEFSCLIHPEMAIPEEATKVHSITDEMVSDQKPFSEVAEQALAFIGDADLGGHNLVRYDLILLQNELKRIGKPLLDLSKRKCYDTLDIYKKKELRSLAKTHLFYTKKEFEGAHRAMADAKAAMAIFDVQVETYGEEGLESKVEYKEAPDQKDLVDTKGKFIWVNNQATFTFGKYKGQSMNAVCATKQGKGYLGWLLKTTGLTDELIDMLNKAIKGQYPLPH